MDHFVDRKLFDIRRSLHLDTRSGRAFGDPDGEFIKVCPRLPEVDDSPAVFDRAGGVEKKAFRR
jgi:hypothetical protein